MENNSKFPDTAKRQTGLLREIVQWVAAILTAVIIAVLIRAFLFEPVEVQGQSMEDTLYDRERLVLYKFGYLFSEPQKGDIVVLEVREGFLNYLPFIDLLPFIQKIYPFPQELDYIKRVIASAGDEVDIKDGTVYINGSALDEDYAKGTTKIKTYGTDSLRYPAVVPEGRIFVLGDNRENSSDSRSIGFIDVDKIKGKAVFRFWPFERFGSIR